MGFMFLVIGAQAQKIAKDSSVSLPEKKNELLGDFRPITFSSSTTFTLPLTLISTLISILTLTLTHTNTHTNTYINPHKHINKYSHKHTHKHPHKHAHFYKLFLLHKHLL